MTPTMRDINKKFSVRYYLNLVLIDEEERRYFKQQVHTLHCGFTLVWKLSVVVTPPGQALWGKMGLGLKVRICQPLLL